MKIIKPSVELLTNDSESNRLKMIEIAGRTCYKSEDKISDDSVATFAKMLIDRGHEAMLEHADFCFSADVATFARFEFALQDLTKHFGFINMLRITVYNGRTLISGNVRAWRDFVKAGLKAEINIVIQHLKEQETLFGDIYSEQNQNEIGLLVLDLKPVELNLDYRKNMFSYEEYIVHKTVSMKFVCDRGVSHEIVRHRLFSFAQESTRYCNYSSDKFGNQITVIEPFFFMSKEVWKTQNYVVWKKSCEWAEAAYFELLRCGASAQEARSVLPNSLKTEIVVTGNIQEWLHFANLRTAPTAHPQMRQIAIPAINLLADKFPTIFTESYREVL